MFSSLDEFGIKTTTIHLSPMTKEIVNEMVSTELSLLPRLTQPLSDMLHHKTKGNPLFVNQLMMNLNRQRLLCPSLSRRRLVWDSDEIRDMEIPENVAVFITKSLDRLPLDVLSALCVLSCFGTSVDVHLIKLLEIEIRIPLIAPLDIAVTESVLGKRNGDKEFYFLHDKLQEAAYSVIKPEICPLQHFRYGLAIGQVAVREEDDKLLITAVEQMNLGGPKACVDGEQGVAVARMNLDAGKTAMKMSDFSSAYSFFDHGISYLRKGHWREQYELSLELFNLAAKCALMNADHAVLDVLTGQILYHARCFEDKCQAINISLTLLYFSGQIKEAINTTIETLSNLSDLVGNPGGCRNVSWR
jgi:predicted ATPase